MVRRDDGGSSTSWTWDTAPNGIGQLARVAASPDGTAREESYDSLGRPSATTTRIGASTLRVLRLYDGFGRLARIVYPRRFLGRAALHRIGPAGLRLRRQRVRGRSGLPSRASRTGAWTASDSPTACGRIGSTSRRPAVSSGSSRATASRRRSSRSVYDWDLRGNLRGRTDQNLAVAETFSYDPVDRLQSATSSQLGALDLRYDAAGNLTFKTGHGAYQYPPPGSPRPHGVLATGDGRRFSYDANGNLLGDGAGRDARLVRPQPAAGGGAVGCRRRVRVPRLRTGGGAADPARDRHVADGQLDATSCSSGSSTKRRPTCARVGSSGAS